MEHSLSTELPVEGQSTYMSINLVWSQEIAYPCHGRNLLKPLDLRS